MGAKYVSDTPALTVASRASDAADRQRLSEEMDEALLATGWVQTSDTGQLADFTPVGDPTAIQTGWKNYGYRVYRFVDAFATESPIYMKVEFGTYGAGASYDSYYEGFAPRITVGTGSNGAGQIINAMPSAILSYIGGAANFTNSISVGGNKPTRAYGDDGIFWMVFKADTSLTTISSQTQGVARPEPGMRIPLFSLSIARTCDESGAPTGEGFVVSYPFFSGYFAFNRAFFELFCYSHIYSYAEGYVGSTRMLTNRPCADLVSVIDGAVTVSRPMVPIAGRLVGVYGVVSVPATAVSNGGVVKATVFGVDERSYMAPHRGTIPLSYMCGSQDGGPFVPHGATALDTFAGLWED